MDIDFSALQKPKAKDPLQTVADYLGQSKEEKKYYKLEREQQERERMRKVYQTYQQNTRQAGTLRNDIAKGIQRGEDPIALLLKAVECISLMTDNTVLYEQTKEDLQAIYGWGLGYRTPLELELEEARARLDRLIHSEHTYTDTHTHNSIQRAITAHRELIKNLEGEIAKHEQ